MAAMDKRDKTRQSKGEKDEGKTISATPIEQKYRVNTTHRTLTSDYTKYIILVVGFMENDLGVRRPVRYLSTDIIQLQLHTDHLLVIAFEGGITTRVITHPSHPNRAFTYDVTFLLQHPRVVAVASQKPPLHFHPHQEEYLQVVEGSLAVEVEGKERILVPEDGEVAFRPWTNHRLYSPVTKDTDEDLKVTRFLLSAESSPELFKLDTVFFENWYAYQDQIVVKGEKVDLIQVMSMFDAGGSYLSLPRWIPFSKTLAYALGVVVGRWLGGILGYQPFYRKWTTDWQSACHKMEMSIFQRRFADRAKTK